MLPSSYIQLNVNSVRGDWNVTVGDLRKICILNQLNKSFYSMFLSVWAYTIKKSKKKLNIDTSSFSSFKFKSGVPENISLRYTYMIEKGNSFQSILCCHCFAIQFLNLNITKMKMDFLHFNLKLYFLQCVNKSEYFVCHKTNARWKTLKETFVFLLV
jgi:hypothetical protein